MSKSGKRERIKRALGISIPAFILVTAGLLFFSSSGRDDSYITYWPAYTLAQHGEMVNYNGERVEQSSSMLQVLVLAVVYKLFKFPLSDTGIVLSLLFAVATILLVYRVALKIEPRAAFLAALLTGSSVYFIYWSLGGLETTMVTFLSVWLIDRCGSYLTGPAPASTISFRRLIIPAAAVLFFLPVRPEAPIVLVSILAGSLVVVYLKKKTAGEGEQPYYRQLMSGLLLLGLVFLGLTALLFIFRVWYFGSLFPQPVAAKAGGVSGAAIREGAVYLKENLFGNIYITLLTLAVAAGVGYAAYLQVRARRMNPYILLSLLYLIANTFFVLLVGGDWMEGGRFLVHQIPVAALLIAVSIMWSIGSRRVIAVVCGMILAVQVVTIPYFAGEKSTGMALWSTGGYYSSLAGRFNVNNFSWFEKYNRVHIRDIPLIYYLEQIVERVIKHKGRTVTVMSGQGGMAAYYLTRTYYKRFRFIDRHGLIDRTLTGCSVVRSIPGSGTSFFFPYEDFFGNLERLKRECNIHKPDIIYELHFQDIPLIIRNGYTVVYVQEGEVDANSAFFHGGPVYFNQFIAVRNDLLEALSGFEPVRLHFRELRR
jgi:hypothetical protein